LKSRGRACEIIAVVDEGANLLAFERMEGAWLGSIDIAINKAYTARPSRSRPRNWPSSASPDEQFFGIHTSNHGRIVIFAGGGIALKRAIFDALPVIDAGLVGLEPGHVGLAGSGVGLAAEGRDPEGMDDIHPDQPDADGLAGRDVDLVGRTS
jgi:hypothetical protein